MSTKTTHSPSNDNLEALAKKRGVHSSLLTLLQHQKPSDVSDAVLCEQIRKGDQTAAFQLLVHHYRYIIAKAMQIASGRHFSDDILQAGAVGLYEAASRYDATKHVKFLTYAHYWILKFLYIEVRNELLPLGGLYIARDNKERLFNYIKYSMMGWTDAQILEKLNIKQEALDELKLLNRIASRLKSLDDLRSDGDKDDLDPYDFLGMPTHKSAEDEYISMELQNYVETLISDLKITEPKLAKFLNYELGLNSHTQLTKPEICKSLKISPLEYESLKDSGLQYLRTQMIEDGWMDKKKNKIKEIVDEWLTQNEPSQ